MVTKRTAYVRVRNNTNKELYGVGLVHKYSDVYKETETWRTLKPGCSTPALAVNYHTGFLTTGCDWWAVSWYDTDLTEQYFTAPNNFRDIIDFMEKIAGPCISAAAAGAAGFITAESGPAALAFAAAAAAATKVLCDQLMNSEGTNGFKRHFLESGDDGGTIELCINEGGDFKIQSCDDSSTTVYKSRSVPAEAREEIKKAIEEAEKHRHPDSAQLPRQTSHTERV
eukprot:Blabericola_migrator_1__10066@NODE_558_length_7604_cov_14_461059_g418_i0_p2_GENE_NODE_558_length_7604_cov_14_461059_g418_i0NODE_558_length_7604_cov_14_461059_g418_i0_p2_ORF_typecomplete_len226_score30_79PUD1_2/PF18457_1/3_7e43TraT/PF05818_12/18TraT/PF05818_12/21Sporozoite_P67/PF05642_11/12_NODE_558_length_7604_cov_14_461059_g418_i0191868